MDQNAKKASTWRTATRRALWTVGGTAAAFTAVTCLLMVVFGVRLRLQDPLNDPELVTMRDRYAEDQEDASLQQSIRELDLAVRRTYFLALERLRIGGRLALVGAAVMMSALGLAAALAVGVKPLGEPLSAERFWEEIARARLWVAGAAVLLAAVAVVLLLSTRSRVAPGLVASPTAEAAAGGETDGHG